MKKELFIEAIFANQNEFREFVHAYSEYDARLTEVKRMLPTNVIVEIETQNRNEFEYDRALENTISEAAEKLFCLNKRSKETLGSTFLDVVNGTEAKEILINEVACVVQEFAANKVAMAVA